MPETYDEFIQSLVPGIGVVTTGGKGFVGNGSQWQEYPEEEAKRVYEEMRAKREEAVKKAYREQTQAFVEKQMVDTLANMTEAQVDAQLKRSKVMEAMREQSQRQQFEQLRNANLQGGMDPRQAHIDAAMRTLSPDRSAAFLRATGAAQANPRIKSGPMTARPLEGAPGLFEISGGDVPTTVRQIKSTGSGGIAPGAKAELDVLREKGRGMDATIRMLTKAAVAPNATPEEKGALIDAQIERAKLENKMKSIYRAVSGGPAGPATPEPTAAPTNKPIKATWTKE